MELKVDNTVYARKHEADGKTQSLLSHLDGVASLCAVRASEFDSEEWGRLIGLLHDVGKANAKFQEKLLKTPNLQVDHSGAGAVWLYRMKGSPEANVGQSLAFAIAGHHAGLPNLMHLGERLRKNEESLSKIEWFTSMPELDLKLPKKLPEWLRCCNFNDKAMKRSCEFWVRFLFSALVDSDRLDAEKFDLLATFGDSAYVATGRECETDIRKLRDRLDSYVNGKMAELSVEDRASRVNTARAEVLKSCREAASTPPGVFSLTVPTGGGKTLSGMSFALNHAVENNMRRVICVIPYTSIIEQNADVYRAAIGDENVLEHHCNYDPDEERSLVGDAALTMFEKAAENWDFPVIVTTTVQFFESLFSNRPSKCRKLHNIARSVIILDEAQSLPPKFLNTILDGLKELTEHYGCSVVISTATQPALGKRPDFQGFNEVRPIIKEPRKLFLDLKRVRYHWPAKNERLSGWGELADMALGHRRVLLITHKRKDARDLAMEMRSKDPSAPLFHLSGQMCPAHRLRTLADINAVMKDRDATCRVVSTQLVEAGVDLDFEVVYRALGGLDSVAQAAGRCNREGRSELGDVHIYRFTEPPGETLTKGRDTCETMLSAGVLDLEDPEVFTDYFCRFYRQRPTDCVVAKRESFNYEDVAQSFKMIDEAGHKNVVVSYGESAAIVADIKRSGLTRALSRKLQRFTVQVFHDSFCEMAHALEEAAEGVYVLGESYKEGYDEVFGLLPPGEIRASSANFIL
ncbi:MAG: CRISPR-associated helicase Cas3' [Synergistaceae bacterium]|jgi:CRISPR-associated endonuclease/helicase Cas3|nr:CRISPR-associated helicase Cas3' [Synergistaceae bacterium]